MHMQSQQRSRNLPQSQRGEQRHFQIGPRIRIGGTVGKVGQNIKIAAGKALSNPLVDAGISLIPGAGPGLAAAAGGLGRTLDTSNGGVHGLNGIANVGMGALQGYGAGRLATSLASGGLSGVAGALGGAGGASGGSGGGSSIPVSLDGSRQTQNQNYSVDENTRNQLNGIQNAYQQAGQAGPSPLLTGAGQYGTAAQTAGNLGFGALSGDPNAVQQLMNPYQQQVIDANNKQWQQTNQQTMNQVNDAATKAGAFGGSRHGVAEGVALAQNNMNQQGQTANLLSQGYGQAQNQASQLAGYGLQGAQQNANLGFGGVGSPSQWYAQMLKQGFIQPTGGTTGQSTSNVSGGVKLGLG